MLPRCAPFFVLIISLFKLYHVVHLGVKVTRNDSILYVQCSVLKSRHLFQLGVYFHINLFYLVENVKLTTGFPRQ
jgi:hypothetical protein